MWWKITIAAVVAIFILAVTIRYRIDVYRRRLLEKFNDIFGLPLPEDYTIPDSDTATIISSYLYKYDTHKDLYTSKDLQSKKEWYDLRLKAFYDISVYAECCRLGVKYSYNSPIGPLSFDLHWSDFDHKIGAYVSLGHYF